MSVYLMPEMQTADEFAEMVSELGWVPEGYTDASPPDEERDPQG